MIDSRSRRMDPWRAPIFSEFKYNLRGQGMKRSEHAKRGSEEISQKETNLEVPESTVQDYWDTLFEKQNIGKLHIMFNKNRN